MPAEAGPSPRACGPSSSGAALRRTRAGPFPLEAAVPLVRLQAALANHSWEALMRPGMDAIQGMPKVEIPPGLVERVRNGIAFPAQAQADGQAAGLGPDGELVAILEAEADGTIWHPRKVFT